MVLYYLTLGTRQSSRTLFPLFAAKTSSRIFDGFCKFSNKVAIPESKCLFGNRDGRLTRVAQQQLLLLRVWHFVVSLISQDKNNSLLAMEYRTVINKIVFTSPEAMVEFSGGKKLKLGLSACQKYSFERSRYFFLDVNKPLGLQITQGSESHNSVIM